ncbi:MAG: cupredoxin domain-containing protein [Bacteroidota bacterium]|nr:cupredoxin domain-containing protein [Bacteroidota bacterium]MDP4231260.1 cupredoxin domain-containing protein [Bacteroidota bacterium]
MGIYFTKAATILLFALMTLSSLSCSSSTSNDIPPNTVTMTGSEFHPQVLTVAKGTEVTWLNDDGRTHTSTSNDGLWDTKDITAGKSKKTTFNTIGSFPYHCIYHVSMGMTGTIVVQ